MPVRGRGAGWINLPYPYTSNAGKGRGAAGAGGARKTIVGFSGGADQAVNVKTNDAMTADRQEKHDTVSMLSNH